MTLSGQLNRFDLDPFKLLVLSFPEVVLIRAAVATDGAGQSAGSSGSGAIKTNSRYSL